MLLGLRVIQVADIVLKAVFGFLVLFASPCFAQKESYEARVLRLQSAITKTLSDTNAPGAGIAIVTKDGPIFVRGFGKSDIERNIDATENTLFRIASISKMFVALSILKLLDEGKLHLTDKVRDIVPEIEFENPWEDTYPVRIVHLLEHTTGWDEYHLVEQTNVPMTLKEGLDYHPHSRRSRWVPGSRMSYSNSGPAVAAYIVEEISGQLYEEYVEENFFRPLKMSNSTFFDDDSYKNYGAKLYGRDHHPVAYRHVIQRPSGAINSSPAEMGNFVRFLLNRGQTDSVRLVSEASIMRMEVTKSNAGARVGLELGFGLANFTSMHKGFVYHGHNGGLPGAVSELAYLPEHGIGHVILLNSSNGRALQTISNLVRDFEVESIQDDVSHDQVAALANFSFDDGYYIPINPRVQWGYFMDRLIDVYKFRKADSVLVKSWLLPNATQIFYPLSDSTFRYRGLNSVGLVKAVDPIEGKVLVTDSRVYRPISTFVVYAQLALAGGWFMMMGIGTCVWVLSLAAFLSGRSANALTVARDPMLTTVLFCVTSFLILYGQRYHTDDLTSPGVLSVTLMALSVWFIVSALWSLNVIYRARRERISRAAYWSMAILSALHVVVVVYLLWFDVLPVISWA